VERSEQILSRANQALQTFERYRVRLTEVTNRLSSLEVQDQVTVKDLALLAQRLEMVRRLDLELSGYVAELGTDGRLLALQLFELNAGLELLRALIEQDYEPIDPAASFSMDGLHGLSEAELLEPLAVARAMGFNHATHLDTRISARGYRQMAQIKRLSPQLSARLIEHFGDLQTLFGATTADLQAVEGVGEGRARVIRDGLVRLAESAYTERLE
jgi:diadenylate cyclase